MVPHLVVCFAQGPFSPFCFSSNFLQKEQILSLPTTINLQLGEVEIKAMACQNVVGCNVIDYYGRKVAEVEVKHHW